MAIYRTQKTSNYSQVSNVLLNTPMPYKAKDLLLFLLSKPQGWRVIKKYICETLQLTKHIVDKSLQWLREKGYAVYRASSKGGGEWDIFETPVITPDLVMPDPVNQAPLETNDLNSNNGSPKQQPEAEIKPIPQEKGIVVCEEKIVLPDNIPNAHRESIMSELENVKNRGQIALILACLSYNIAIGGVRKSITGYLRSLVVASNNGIFEFEKPVEQPRIQDYERVKIDKSRPEKGNEWFPEIRKALRGIL